MTVALNDLTELYSPSYFKEVSKQYTLTEKQIDPNKLSKVNVITSGSGIFIVPEFLGDCERIFKKIEKKLSFRDNNDGTFLLEKDGVQYIIYVELKSKFEAGIKKAIRQIPVSSIKIKSFLRNIQTFKLQDYRELGLIISYPPAPEDKYDSKNNAMVLNHKVEYLADQKEDQEFYDKELRHNKEVYLTAENFPKLPQDKLHEDIKFKSMMVYYRSVSKNGENVDLDNILH